MEDKNSSLYIDPFKCPSDGDIKKSWNNWKEAEKPCTTAAIKWLQCMGISKEYYRMQGGDANDGSKWHTFMLTKCFAPYTDYHECRIDQREAKMEKMKAAFGEEKWNESQEQVKLLLKAKLGDDKGEKVWEYRNSYNQRFKDLRKAVDEERGIIRDGMKVPDITDNKTLSSAPVEATPPPSPEQDPPPSDEKPPEAGIKGWWSEPESRFRKSGSS